MTSMTGATGAYGSGKNTGSYIGAPNPNASSGLKSAPGYRTMQKFTPEMMQLFEHMMSQLGPDSFLSRLAGGDQSMFEQMEAPALQQFAGLQGNLASRFSGMGMGAQKSSGFQNTMNQASSDFAQQLQSQRLGLQRQALSDLSGMSNLLLQQQPYAMVGKRQSGGSSGWGGLIGAGVGGLAGMTTGNPYWAMQGAQLGQGIGSAF